MTQLNPDITETVQQANQANPLPAEAIQHTASQLATAVSHQQMMLSEKVGAIKATGFFKKVSTVTEIKLIAEIKDTKQYKGLDMIDYEGNSVTCNTFQDFCKALGFSYEKVNQDIQNLSAFGEDFLETSQRMGVGYRDLRKLRKLDEADRELIINGEAVQAEDKDSLIDLIEEMSVKHATAKSELEQQVKDLTADNTAKEQVLATKNKKIDELDTKLSLRKDPANAHVQAELLEKHLSDEMAKHSTAVLTAISQFNTQMITLNEQASEDAPHLLPKLESDISYVYNRIAELATTEGINIDLAELVTPSWMADFNPSSMTVSEKKGELEGVNDFELVGQTPEEVEAMNEL